jgi:hypothetical protein
MKKGRIQEGRRWKLETGKWKIENGRIDSYFPVSVFQFPLS